ncbi:MAG: phosphatase [Bacilli bacterium]|nr:phosphatase [Bacilli bacterium]
MNEEELKLAKAEKKAYMIEWRKNNKERIKVHNTRYWLKRSELRKGNEGVENANNTRAK